jgi:sigma-B regulation protein RsbU (phosphoserine phosphatase)
LEDNTARYASAGHPPMLVMHIKDGSLEEFNENNLMMGVIENTKYENYLIDIKPRDRILLYTDGITEAENNNEELFGENRLKYFLKSNFGKNIDSLADNLLNTVVEWSDAMKKETQSDDIALVIIDIEE